MAKRITRQAPEGSLRALGGAEEPFSLGNAELDRRAVQEVLDQTPETVARIALARAHASHDVLQLLLSKRILTDRQHALLGEALLHTSDAERAAGNVSPDNRVLWGVILRCGDRTQEGIRALFNPGDGSMDTLV